MKFLNLLPVLAALVAGPISNAQNVGIGTANPQNKLHVAGGIRVDNLAGSAGIVTKNANGDLSAVAFNGNNAHALRGDGTFGIISGTIPSSGVATSKIYNNTALINAGYNLIGEIPTVFTYSSISTTFGANTRQPTYVRGIAGNVSAPVFSSGGAPPLAVWTGSLMYVWLGNNFYSYNPDTDQWQVINGTGDAGDIGSNMVWTGTEVILWKGQPASGTKYNPATNTFTALPTANAPSTRIDYTMIWDGSRVIIWGGAVPGGAALNTGSVYNPATNTWTAMSTTGAPVARRLHTATWSTTTNRMIVWGGSPTSFGGEMNTGGLYDPATNTWTGATSTTNAPSVRNNHNAVWTGTEMIILGGQFSSGTAINTGGRYNPATNTWVATSTTGSPAVFKAAAAWSGSQVYFFGGQNGANGTSNLYSYNPSSDIWTLVSSTSERKLLHHCFFKSNLLLVWGGLEETLTIGLPFSNEGFRYFFSSTPSSATTLTSGPLYLYEKN